MSPQKHNVLPLLLFCFQLDVIVVDLDGGSIRVPENVSLSLMPEPILSRVKHSLNMVNITIEQHQMHKVNDI